MTLSTTFQSRISRTKKRLSEDSVGFSAFVLAVLGLFAILTYGLRAIALDGSYGAVQAEIPVVPVDIDDPAYHEFEEKPANELKKTTTAVVLTAEAFYFGDLQAFSDGFGEVRNKFVIPHVDGEPQLLHLLRSLDRWAADRAERLGIKTEKVLVFMPSGDIPMPIVIQVMAGLSRSPLAERIVLGGAIL